ncbi:MAG: phage tail tape measure protein [Sporomusaceae bacterium]|nr:phage tail tape measure protein [Sporomusaceae bacterium]
MASKTYEIAFNLAARLGSSFSSTFSGASQQLSTLQTNVKSTRAAMRELEMQQRKGIVSTLEYAASYEKLTAQLYKAEQLQTKLAKAEVMQSRLKNFRGQAVAGLAGSAAAGAVVAAPVLAFAKAEQSATALKAAMMDSTGSVGESFAKINSLAVELGNKLPGTTSDFHDLFRVMLQNGIAAEQILGGVGQAAAYLGVQLKLPYETAGLFAAQMQKSTGTADADMMKFMDTVQRLTNLGVKADDLNQAFSKFGPTMSVLKAQGLDGANAYGTLLAMLTQVGMEGGSAGNSLGKVFRAGFDEKKLGKANDSLAEFGMSLKFTNERGEFAGLDNFFTQMEKLSTLDTTTRVGVIKELFGDDAEVLQTVNIMLEKGRAGYDALLAKTAKQASLEQRVNEQLKTMTNTWDSLAGTVTNLVAALGGPLAEKLKPILDAANSLVGDRLMPWVENNAGLVGTLGAIAAGAVTLSAAWWGMGLAAATILAPMITFYKWMFLGRTAIDGTVIASRAAIIATRAWTTAQWLINAAMAANPIGLVIIGVTALIAAGWALYKNWDTVISWLEEKWNNLKNLFGAGINVPVSMPVAGGVGDIPVIPHAAGGIFSRPHVGLLAEAGVPESAIPIDGSSRSLGLWQKTGEMLGASAGGGGTFTATFAPVIQVGDSAKASDVQKVLDDERAKFRRMWEDMMQEARRLSYA